MDGVGGGGASFVESLTTPGAVHNPVEIAFAVLRKWCESKPEESYGGMLFNVLNLQRVSPATAREFQSRLVPPSAAIDRLQSGAGEETPPQCKHSVICLPLMCVRDRV